MRFLLCRLTTQIRTWLVFTLRGNCVHDVDHPSLNVLGRASVPEVLQARRVDYRDAFQSAALATGSFGPGRIHVARDILRYTNSMVHLYFYLNSDEAMTPSRWALMERWRLLSTSEIRLLQWHGASARLVVVYSWAVQLLIKNMPAADSLKEPIEDCLRTS